MSWLENHIAETCQHKRWMKAIGIISLEGQICCDEDIICLAYEVTFKYGQWVSLFSLLLFISGLFGKRIHFLSTGYLRIGTS